MNRSKKTNQPAALEHDSQSATPAVQTRPGKFNSHPTTPNHTIQTVKPEITAFAMRQALLPRKATETLEEYQDRISVLFPDSYEIKEQCFTPSGQPYIKVTRLERIRPRP